MNGHLSFTDLLFRVVFNGIKRIDNFPNHENKKVDGNEQSKHGKQLVVTDDLPGKKLHQVQQLRI